MNQRVNPHHCYTTLMSTTTTFIEYSVPSLAPPRGSKVAFCLCLLGDCWLSSPFIPSLNIIYSVASTTTHTLMTFKSLLQDWPLPSYRLTIYQTSVCLSTQIHSNCFPKQWTNTSRRVLKSSHIHTRKLTFLLNRPKSCLPKTATADMLFIPPTCLSIWLPNTSYFFPVFYSCFHCYSLGQVPITSGTGKVKLSLNSSHVCSKNLTNPPFSWAVGPSRATGLCPALASSTLTILSHCKTKSRRLFHPQHWKLYPKSQWNFWRTLFHPLLSGDTAAAWLWGWLCYLIGSRTQIRHLSNFHFWCLLYDTLWK